MKQEAHVEPRRSIASLLDIHTDRQTYVGTHLRRYTPNKGKLVTSQGERQTKIDIDIKSAIREPILRRPKPLITPSQRTRAWSVPEEIPRRDQGADKMNHPSTTLLSRALIFRSTIPSSIIHTASAAAACQDIRFTREYHFHILDLHQ